MRNYRQEVEGLRSTLVLIQEAIEGVGQRTLEYAKKQMEDVMTTLEPFERRLAVVEGLSPSMENLKDEVILVGQKVRDCCEAHRLLSEHIQSLGQRILSVEGAAAMQASSRSDRELVEEHVVSSLQDLCQALYQVQGEHSRQITDLWKRLRESLTGNCGISTTTTSTATPSPVTEQPPLDIPHPPPPRQQSSMREGNTPRLHSPFLSPVTTVLKGEPSPLARLAQETIAKSPVKYHSARAGALEALKVMDMLSVEESRDASLKEAIREVSGGRREGKAATNHY